MQTPRHMVHTKPSNQHMAGRSFLQCADCHHHNRRHARKNVVRAKRLRRAFGNTQWCHSRHAMQNCSYSCNCDSNGRQPCDTCLPRLCLCLETSLRTGGLWITHEDVATIVGKLFATIIIQKCLVTGTAIQRHDGLVAHTFMAKLEAAKFDGLVTDMSNWTQAERTFASIHRDKHAMWCNREKTVLRKKSPHNMYDKATVLAGIKRAGLKGVSLTEVVIEYEHAYIDLLSLLSAEGSQLKRIDSQIWFTPQLTLRQTTSRKKRKRNLPDGTILAPVTSSAPP